MSFDGMYFFIEIGLPLLLFVTWAVFKRRQMASAELHPVPLAPAEPEPTPNIFLRRFSAPERAYMRQTLRTARNMFFLLTWLFIFEMTLPTFNTFANGALWTDQGAMRWYTFVQLLSAEVQFMAIVSIMTAAVAIFPLRWGSFGTFCRTRPLGLSFLFRTRALSALTVLALAFLTAGAISLAVFVLLHGRAWQHLPPVIPRHLGPDDSDLPAMYAAVRASSVPRMFLSLLITGCLICSIAITLLCVPTGPSRTAVPRAGLFFLAALWMAVPVLNLLGAFDVLHKPRWLFFYWDPGPPPSLAFAVVPIALTILLLFIAGRLLRRVEL